MVRELVRGLRRAALKRALSLPKRAGEKALRVAGRYSDTAEGIRLAIYGSDEEPTWQAYPPPDPVPEPVTVTPRTAPIVVPKLAAQSELKAQTVAALKSQAKKRGIEVPRRIKKADLIALLHGQQA